MYSALMLFYVILFIYLSIFIKLCWWLYVIVTNTGIEMALSMQVSRDEGILLFAHLTLMF